MMQEFWMRLASGRYVAALEAEVTRLRAENRGLLNSILGIAGVPPISIVEDFTARTQLVRPAGGIPPDTCGITGTPQSRRAVQAAAPLRKRSWQQINRALEFESAKKKDPSSEQISLPVARKE